MLRGHEHHKRGRRRGTALVDAIHTAVLEELSERGYADLSMESVAARARTGKTSLYRRWHTKRDLVVDVLLASPPEMRGDWLRAECEVAGVPSGELDRQMLSGFTAEDALQRFGSCFANAIATLAEAIRAVGCETPRDPDLANVVNDQFHAKWRQAGAVLLDELALRGDIPTGADVTAAVEAFLAVITYRTFLLNRPVTDVEIAGLLATVLLPLVRTSVPTATAD